MRVNEEGPTRATQLQRDLQMARLGGWPRESRKETDGPGVEAVQQEVKVIEPSPRSQFVQGLKGISEAVVSALRSAIKGR